MGQHAIHGVIPFLWRIRDIIINLVTSFRVDELYNFMTLTADESVGWRQVGSWLKSVVAICQQRWSRMVWSQIEVHAFDKGKSHGNGMLRSYSSSGFVAQKKPPRSHSSIFLRVLSSLPCTLAAVRVRGANRLQTGPPKKIDATVNLGSRERGWEYIPIHVSHCCFSICNVSLLLNWWWVGDELEAPASPHYSPL